MLYLKIYRRQFRGQNNLRPRTSTYSILTNLTIRTNTGEVMNRTIRTNDTSKLDLDTAGDDVISKLNIARGN